MEIWHIWIIAALLLFAAEIFTTGFALFCLAVGAAAAGVAACYTEDLTILILVFAVVSICALVVVRPLLLRYFFRRNRGAATNAGAMIGRTATVVETIDAARESGRVRLDGVEWTAVTADGSVIETGARVVIEKMDSIVLTVRKV